MEPNTQIISYVTPSEEGALKNLYVFGHTQMYKA